ncbi:GDP-L-fucose synthase [uncultured archaeon]|nr:GDP-L-fucose synthase [uncultured archaeon]
MRLVPFMRVFISGAGGFLGACATYYFEKAGWDVFAGVRKPRQSWRLAESRAQQVEMDIVDARSVEQAVRQASPDLIINFATYGAYPGRQTDLSLIRQTNVEGVRHLLDAARSAGVRRLLQIGTSSEYGLKDVPISEEAELVPDTDYARAKLEGSRLALAANGKDGLEAVVVRPFSPFGPWEDGKRLVPALVMAALQGRAPQLASPRPMRDFMFVDDLMEGIRLAALQEGIGGEVFNLSMGHQMSVGDMAGLVGKLLPNAPTPVWGAQDNVRREPPMWQADISKAARVLGWKPKVSAEEGVRRTIEWFKAHRALYEKQQAAV